MEILKRHDYSGYIKRVLSNHALDKKMTYRSHLIPFLDAICAEPVISRESLIQTLDLDDNPNPVDAIRTLLTNVTMPIQKPEKGSVWPIEDGGWYETLDGDCYRVNTEFAKAWHARRNS
jgi:hypothetical protein